MSEYDDAGGAPPAEQPQAPQTAQPVDPGQHLIDALQPEYEDEGGEYSDAQRQQIAAAQQAQELNELRSGDRVAEITRERAAYDQAIEGLVSQHPAMRTTEAVQAMQPIYEAVAEEYGEDVASDIHVLERIYEQAGGDAQFVDALAERQYIDSVFSNLSRGDGPLP